MRSRLSRPIRIALWSSSVGVALLLARRFLRSRPAPDVGRVSDEWLAQQRWPPADPLTL
jgi:hypothetical protein